MKVQLVRKSVTETYLISSNTQQFNQHHALEGR